MRCNTFPTRTRSCVPVLWSLQSSYICCKAEDIQPGSRSIMYCTHKLNTCMFESSLEQVILMFAFLLVVYHCKVCCHCCLIQVPWMLDTPLKYTILCLIELLHAYCSYNILTSSCFGSCTFLASMYLLLQYCITVIQIHVPSSIHAFGNTCSQFHTKHVKCYSFFHCATI